MQVQNEQTIPIDIHCNKLLDWLVSRRHVERDWSGSVLPIRQKINNAIQDMPEVEEIKQLLIGSYINYFHCIQLVDILKETEADSKNIFGKYSSQRMKDWQEIVHLYEKNNIFLAEAAQMLIRNVSYEIPALKKTISKCQQLQEEYSKKEVEYGKQAVEFKEKYAVACKEIGIKGENLRRELLDLLKALPVAFNRIADDVKTLQDAREFYEQFLQFILNNEDFSSNCLPLLSYLLTKGKTTVYEWTYGEAPEVVEENKPVMPLDTNNGEDNSDQIDFGDVSDDIDFGDDTSSTTNGDFVHVEKIDFGDGEQAIELCTPESESSWVVDPSISIMEGTTGDVGKIARGDHALSILDYHITRNMLLNDLRELEGFLEQRLSEMQSEGDVLSGNQFSSAGSVVQLQTTNSVSKMRDQVQHVISQLVTTQMQHLFLIQRSDKYVDRLTDSLQHKLDLSEKMLQSKDVMIEKQKVAREEERSLKPKLDLLIEKTKILQKQMESDISKRYKGRPVNIMGVTSV